MSRAPLEEPSGLGRSTTVLQIVAVGWGLVGFVIASSALGDVNPDARPLVITLSVFGPLAAVGSAYAMRRERWLVAGVALLFSVVTPTYFAWVVNVIPLVLIGFLYRYTRSTERTVA